jgi:hypothetical protein
MMRLGRRASLLLAFSLLAWTATAYAECAWVLWVERTDCLTKLGPSCGRIVPRTTARGVSPTRSRPRLQPRKSMAKT